MNELTDLMERTTADLRPDVEALVSGGIVRGRRLRTRRRIGTGAGVLASAAAIGMAFSLAPGGGGGAATPSPATGFAASGTGATVTPEVQVPTRDQLVRGVALTSGTGHVLRSWGSRSAGFVAASWSFVPAAGGGAGLLSVLVEKVEMPYAGSDRVTFHVEKGRMPSAKPPAGMASEVQRQPYSPSVACHADGGTCHALPDGTWLSTSTFDEPASGGGPSGIVSTHATLWTADGLAISATAYNAMDEKNVQPTRQHPVLSEAQLAQLVRSAHLG